MGGIMFAGLVPDLVWVYNGSIQRLQAYNLWGNFHDMSLGSGSGSVWGNVLWYCVGRRSRELGLG